MQVKKDLQWKIETGKEGEGATYTNRGK